MIEQGLSDEFLNEQLGLEEFENACKQKGQKVLINRRVGYDHSYYFISSFIGDHIKFHLKNLT